MKSLEQELEKYGYKGRLVGCMDCQKVCPENKSFFDWFEAREEFSEEETDLLLEKVPVDELRPETIRKLERLDLVEYLEILPRNLRALLLD